MRRTTLAQPPAWSLPRLHEHFQGAADLELWTIPYYLTVLYSIKDPSTEAYRLVQAAVYQEMLHLQLVANIANAYGYSPTLAPPAYRGTAVPHLDFDLDTPNPTTEFTPYSAELGPLDAQRVNTMCLVEYPEWRTEREPDLADTQQAYGSIGEFYDALRVGMSELRAHVQGSRRQIDEFGPFYQGTPRLSITEFGDAGFRQAMTLVDIIVDQGEGQTQPIETVPTEFRNTADGFKDAWPHFQKFDHIRRLPRWPAVYAGEALPPSGSPGQQAQQRLVADFAGFLAVLNRMFAGEPVPAAFGVQMAKLGGDILACWQQQAIPRFS
ncbi:MAG: ferritin-like protein [Burkholderiales bacterium]|nr:ferritin-like protein [Burkholderiales bacterium]